VAIRYIIWSFGIFLPVLVCRTKKNLATLQCAYLQAKKASHHELNTAKLPAKRSKTFFEGEKENFKKKTETRRYLHHL
jgi:hypothetical protein